MFVLAALPTSERAENCHASLRPFPLPRLRRQAEAIAACYQLLPAVHRLFRRVAGEEDDYIAQPKVSSCAFAWLWQ